MPWKTDPLDAPDQVGRHAETIHVDFWYPRIEKHATHVEIGLVDVRAADSIRITYDFERDGYVILQASKFEWLADEEPDPDWKEVAFIPAWGRRVARFPEFP
jgi:hypothetical protein